MAKRTKTVTKRQKIKRKLKKELSAVKMLKYKTTYKDIKKYFKLINEHVFDNKLSPFNDITLVHKPRNYIGQVVVSDKIGKGTRNYILEMFTTLHQTYKKCSIAVYLYQRQSTKYLLFVTFVEMILFAHFG